MERWLMIKLVVNSCNVTTCEFCVRVTRFWSLYQMLSQK